MGQEYSKGLRDDFLKGKRKGIGSKERVRRQDELERKVDVFHLKDPPDERC